MVSGSRTKPCESAAGAEVSRRFEEKVERRKVLDRDESK